MIWEDLAVQAIPEPNSGCLLWDRGSFGWNKYGAAFDTRSHKMRAAHRLSYELAVGEIPRGLCVCHRCDVPACINPQHLFIGTTQDNTADMVAKGRNHIPTNAVFSDAEVRAIFDDPRSYPEITKDFGAAASTISLIKSGAQWGKVTGKRYTPPIKTECAQGHPWVEQNLATKRDGSRYCKLCNRARALKNYYGRSK